MIVGFAREDITPAPGYPLGGFLERYLGDNHAEGTLNSIFARAMYLSDEREEFILISVEVVVIENGFAKEVREAISKVTGIPVSNIEIFATHTHSAPDTMLEIWLYKHFLPDEYPPLIERYRNFLKDKLIHVAIKAKENAKKAKLYIGVENVEGACANRINPELEKDTQLMVVFSDDLRGALVNFTCHPTVLHADNMMYSGDFFSYVDIKGKVLVFSVGAAGDQSTRFVRKKTGWEEAERIGEMLKEAIIKSFNIKEKLGEKIEKHVFTVKLRKRDLQKEQLKKRLEDRRAELIETLEKEKDPGKIRKIENTLGAINLMLQIYDIFEEELSKMPEFFDMEGVILAIGKKLAIVFLPVELFCKYGLEIKKKSPFEYTMIVTYANGYFGYLPSKEAYEEIDYEALATNLEAGSAEILTEKTIEALENIYQKVD